VDPSLRRVSGSDAEHSTLWVPETLQRLRDLRVFVDQATEPIAFDHRGGRVGRHRWECSKRRGLAEGPVGRWVLKWASY
jgi:hypothetical protein